MLKKGVSNIAILTVLFNSDMNFAGLLVQYWRRNSAISAFRQGDKGSDSQRPASVLELSLCPVDTTRGRLYYT